MDAMPVVFSEELDPGTVQPADIEATQVSVSLGSVYCTTFLCANDAGELRTVLLIGVFGTNIIDEPTEVEVIGNAFDNPEESISEERSPR